MLACKWDGLKPTLMRLVMRDLKTRTPLQTGGLGSDASATE